MRHLVAFFVLGAVLLAGKGAVLRVWSGHEGAPLSVHIKQGASQADRERAIDEAVLVEEALRAGGARIDPVVREQLLVSMRATQRSETAATSGAHDENDEQLLARAIALGLHIADPVTRQRLVFQAEQLLTAHAVLEQPSDSVLSAYVRTHAQRYSLPPRLTFVHVFLSPTRHDPGLTAAAQTLLSTLTRERAGADAARTRGDPTLLPHEYVATDAVTLDAQLGAGFAAEVLRGPLGAWFGPVSSAYGQHLVLLQECLDGRLPALSELRERALADYCHDRRREVLRERLRALRAHYRVQLRSPRS
ncbi:MAG: hypothetical protein RLZZ450_5281 [Pseudomonadota bacterium]|jgi:hypothetical protein